MSKTVLMRGLYGFHAESLIISGLGSLAISACSFFSSFWADRDSFKPVFVGSWRDTADLSLRCDDGSFSLILVVGVFLKACHSSAVGSRMNSTQSLKTRLLSGAFIGLNSTMPRCANHLEDFPIARICEVFPTISSLIRISQYRILPNAFTIAKNPCASAM